MSTSEKVTPEEAINEFYKLKQKYEADYYEKYVRPIVKSGSSKKEKRIAYSKLPKPACVNCKRNVGNIFSINADSENFVKKYILKCGDRTGHPCPLDIQVVMSNRDLLDKMIQRLSKMVDDIKMNIIKFKNNSMFLAKPTELPEGIREQINERLIEEFANYSEELKIYGSQLGVAIETNILRNDNPERKNILKKELFEYTLLNTGDAPVPTS